MTVGVILPAAGAGRRMGNVRKAFMPVAGRAMLAWSVEAFLTHPAVHTIAVPLSDDDLADPPEWLKHVGIRLVSGGAERAESVRSGLEALPPECDVVLVHDAARPLVTHELINRVLAAVQGGVSATVGIPVTDTLHETDAAGVIHGTPDRTRFWRAQTPQGFPRAVLARAFAETSDASLATDEAGLVARLGETVQVVPGEPWNVKVTTPDDVAFVENLLNSRHA